jgi:Flp pilus assembly protein TadD
VRRAGLFALLTVVSVGVSMHAGSQLPSQSESVATQLRLGDELLLRGQYREALNAYRKAREAPESEVARAARAGIVVASLRMAEFGQALGESELLVGDAPDNPRALTLHGDALWSSGLFDEAEARYRQALALAPTRRAGTTALRGRWRVAAGSTMR